MENKTNLTKKRRKEIVNDIIKLLDKYNIVEEQLFITLLISENFKDIEAERKEYFRSKLHPALWGDGLK